MNNDGCIKKENFYKRTLNISPLQYENLLRAFPTIKKLKEESVTQKISAFEKAGLTKQDIVNNIRVLSCPADKFLLRLAIHSHFGGDLEDFLDKQVYITNENKLYARNQFLKDNHYNDTSYARVGEKIFASRLGVDTEKLKKLYPLTEEIKNQFLLEYKSMSEIDQSI